MQFALPILIVAPLFPLSATVAQGAVQGEDEDFKFRPVDEQLHEHGDDHAHEQGGELDPQDEAKMLFRRVEKRLREIDELLNDASSGQTSGLSSISESISESGKDSGIGKLIESSRKNSQGVIEDIDRLLELFEGT